MQRAVMKVIDSAEHITMNMLFSPPKALASGKDGWRLWSAACEFTDMIRDEIPSGLMVNLYIQDGLHAGQFERWMNSRHQNALRDR